MNPGHRLFARYAAAPNALGYCGPAEAAGLQAIARGEQSDVDLVAIARRFSGAWPYQCLIAELAGIDDPLDERVGRAYWTGNELTAQIDPRRFGELLLARFGTQAGHYWTHLDEALLDEVTPTHAFHVFGVYPWTRLLHTGRDEPRTVLDRCRITPGEVIDRAGPRLVVRARALAFDGRTLSLAARADMEVAGPLLDPGTRVALHWGEVCDVLTSDQCDALELWTERQLEATNRRLESRCAPLP